VALTVGELVGYLRLDDSQWNRTLDRAERTARTSTSSTAAMATTAGRSVDTLGGKAAAASASLGTLGGRVAVTSKGLRTAGGDFSALGQSIATAATSADRGVATFTGSLGRLGDKAAGASSRLGTFKDNLGQIGQQSGLLPGFMTPAMGAVVGVGVAAVAASKAAISWESAWAGVTKTVDGSPEQMAALEGELRNLAKVLPSTHEEIAAVAEAGGQLGIQRDNITAFTKTMVDLGETTNLSADEAATALARFMNIMGTSQADVERLGSSIVALGNSGASTEREIADMAVRIASAGAMLGFTEGDVLGLANALSSVGIEAEAGGTAISKVMIDISKAVDLGNNKLETFASVAGMSVGEFATAFREDAGSAITAFIGGLGRIQASGESITPILEDLGFVDVRVGNALRSAAAASDMFTESMDMGNEAFEENTALVEEANKRYETMASRLEVAKNKMRDAAIEGGTPLAEGFVAIAEGAAAAITGIDGVAGALDGIGSSDPDMPAGMSAVDIVRTLGEMPGAVFNFPGEGTNNPGEAWGEAWKRASGFYDEAAAAADKAATSGASIGHLADLTGDVGGNFDDASVAAGDFSGAIGETEQSAEQAADELKAMQEIIEELGTRYSDIEGAQDAVSQSRLDALQPLRDLKDAQVDLVEAQQDLADADSDAARESAAERVARAEQAVAAAEAAITLKGNSEAALDNRDAMREMADDIKKSAAELLALDGTGFKSRAEMERGRQKFIEVATQLGYTREEARKYARQLGLIPGKVPTQVYINGYDAAFEQARTLRDELNQIPRTIPVEVIVTETRRDEAMADRQGNYEQWAQDSGPRRRRAVGGPVTAGQPYLVGEEGPEMFVPGAHGSIVPNHSLSTADNRRIVNAQTVVIQTPDPHRAWDSLNSLAVMQ
jgi:TP901 family phage tail tape measure protein